MSIASRGGNAAARWNSYGTPTASPTSIPHIPPRNLLARSLISRLPPARLSPSDLERRAVAGARDPERVPIRDDHVTRHVALRHGHLGDELEIERDDDRERRRRVARQRAIVEARAVADAL